MSTRPEKPASEMSGHLQENLPARTTVTYEVGYKRPPSQHRFRKSQCGQPADRPKGAKNKFSINAGFGFKAAEQYLREEAYRPNAVREGERTIELPAIQAVFRAMGVSAMKGNRLAQKDAGRAGHERRRERSSFTNGAVRHKRRIQACLDAGDRALREGWHHPVPAHPASRRHHPRSGCRRRILRMAKDQKAAQSARGSPCPPRRGPRRGQLFCR